MVGLGQEVVHHYTVPDFSVVVLQLRVCDDFDPVVAQHIFKGVITCQCGKTAFSGEVLDGSAFYVLHPIFLKGLVLGLDNPELPGNLEQQKLAFEVLKGEVIEFEYGKISLYKKWVLIRLELLPC